MSAQTASLPLLCLCGSPEILASGQATSLQLKYRKGLALLGFLAAHADRVFRRETLADLLWPGIDTSAGRANLRVVLSDLGSCFKRLGLDAALEVQRDWLALRPGQTLLTDLALLAGDQLHGDIQLRQQLLSRTEKPWLEDADEGTSEDFQEWLTAQRQHLAQRWTSWREATASTAPGTPDGPQAPQINVLTLLHLELGDPAGSDGLTTRLIEAPLLERLVNEARFFGARLVEHNDNSLTFAFGLDSQHTGQRWLALRCAGSLQALYGDPMELAMAVTAGRTLVIPGPQPRIMGWRKRLVARLALCAEAGEIVCDDSLQDLVPHFQMQDLGTRHFRGLNQSLQLYGRSLAHMPPLMLPPGGDFSGSFFAREALLDRPAALLACARAGQAAGLCVSAEPGAGKTRLAWEFAQRVQREGRLAFWISALPEAQNIPWRGLHDFFGKLLGGGEGVAEQLERTITQLQTQLSDEARQAILQLVGTYSVAQTHQAALAEGISAILRGPGRGPVLLVIDDVQWLDGPSAGILNRVIQRGDPVLWLLTRRSGEAHALQMPGLQELVLPPLDDQAAAAILQSLPDADQLSPEARQGRIVNARGLPLYLLADSVPHESGSHFSEFCQALLNRLGAARAAMEAAAVLGMLFRFDDLGALCGPAEARQACDIALAGSLLVARGPEQASFFHPRLREYLLSVQPPQTLQKHAAIAASRLQARDQHAEAALLWEQADDRAKARQAWYQAARLARQEDDILAACSHFARLALLGYFDAAEGVRARLLHAHCLMARDGYGSTEAHEFLQAIDQTGMPLETLDPDTRFNLEMLAYLGSSSQGHIDGLDHARALEARAATSPQRMTACWAMGNTLFWLGRFDEARDWLERCVALAHTLDQRERMLFFPSDLLIFAQAELGWAQWLLGDTQPALATVQASLHSAQQSPTGQDPCIAHIFAALVHWSADDLAAAAPHALQAYQTAEAEGFMFWRAVAGLLLNLAQAHPGQTIDLAALTQDSDTMLAGYRAGTTTALWLVAASVVASAQHEEALVMLEQALQASEHYEHRYCRMDLWRLRGLVLQALGRHNEARPSLAEAARIGREVGALGWLRQWQHQLPESEATHPA